MAGTEVFDYWWLIPLFLIVLCVFGSKACCAGRGQRNEYLPDKKAAADSASALEVLSRRYARGEIDDEEYQRKKELITQTSKGETQ